MTDLPDWPPPVCQPCRQDRHEECDPIPFCECESGLCLPLLTEDAP